MENGKKGPASPGLSKDVWGREIDPPTLIPSPAPEITTRRSGTGSGGKFLARGSDFGPPRRTQIRPPSPLLTRGSRFREQASGWGSGRPLLVLNSIASSPKEACDAALAAAGAASGAIDDSALEARRVLSPMWWVGHQLVDFCDFTLPRPYNPRPSTQHHRFLDAHRARAIRARVAF